MATVDEIIKEILSIEEVDTYSNLKKKGKKKLESQLKEMKAKNQKEDVVEDVSDEVKEVKTSQVDLEALKAQMLEELKEEARKQVEEEQKNEVAPKRTSKPKIDRYEQVPVMNITFGSLVYRSKKSGLETIWGQYGDVEYIEFQELITMKSSSRGFFDEPFILILYEEVVDYFSLNKKYENISKDSIEKSFKLPFDGFKDFVDNAPKGVQSTIVSMAKDKVSRGELDSLRMINFLNNKFKIEIGQRG